MAMGDFTQRVDIRREDANLGYWQTPFNAMAKSLDEKTKEIAASEKRYRELVNSVKEGVYQSEPGVDGAFTFINKRWCGSCWDIANRKKWLGTKVKDIYVDTEDRKHLCENLKKTEYGEILYSSVREKQ